MVEPADRSRVGEEPRGDPTREWEVFLRDDGDDPLRHVGSVSAPSAEVAHEQSSRLFGWYADDVWLCPAGEVHRFSTHDRSPNDESDSGRSGPASDGNRTDPESESDRPDSVSDGNRSEGDRPDGTDPSASEAVVDEDGTAAYEGDDEPRVTEL